MAKDLSELGKDNPFEHLSKEQIIAFGKELDVIKNREKKDYGQSDIDYMETVERTMTFLEKSGRTLIYCSIEPVTWGVGVVQLSLQKIMDITHAHNVYHRQFDWADYKYNSDTYEADWCLDNELWKTEHNSNHHPFSNELGKDPTLAPFGTRLFKQIPWRPYHMIYPFIAIPTTLATEYILALHVTGVLEYVFSKWSHDTHLLEDESPKGVVKTLWKATKKIWRKTKKDYIIHPLSGGIMAPKILVGNFIANAVSSGYFVAVNITNHTNDRTIIFREGDVPKIKGAKYIQQTLSTTDFKAGLLFSVLNGYFNYHTIHHLFPSMPAWRYRKIAPEVRSIFEKYNVPYHVDSLGSLMKEAMKNAMTGAIP